MGVDYRVDTHFYLAQFFLIRLNSFDFNKWLELRLLYNTKFIRISF